MNWKSSMAAAMFAAMLVLPTDIAAQEISPSHMAAAREAVAVSEATNQMDSILPSMSERIKQQLISNRPDAAVEISAVVDEIAVSLAPRRGDLEREIARIYAGIFSEEELKSITAFYQTDAGQKLIDQTPVVFRAMEQASRVWTTGVQRDFDQVVREKITAAGLN